MSRLPQRPSVAAIVPCLNEVRFIGPFLDRVFAMDYDPESLTVWVADGMSDDGTREVLFEYAQREKRLHVLDNPRRTTACALNIALRASRSDVVVRFDVHAEYPPNYVSHLVSLLQTHPADNVGAVRVTASGNTTRENVFASLISAPFASGGAPWRSRPLGLREVESVFCGCYPREVFDRIGVFDETMIRIEDREFNARLRQNGGRVVLDPRLSCTYHPRTQLLTYLKWTYSGPFRIFYSRRLTRTPLISPRNLAPVAFAIYHLALPISVRLFGWLAFIPLIVYAIVAVLASVPEAMLHRRWKVVFLLPPLFYITHLLYGLGGIWGWIRSFLPIPPPMPEGKFSH